MARTYRRKNAEQVRGVSCWTWSKQFGWYGERNWVGDIYCWTEPTKRELYHTKRELHSDKKNYGCPPCKGYRKETHWKEKMDFKGQFSRWLKNPEYEIVNNEKMHRDNMGWY